MTTVNGAQLADDLNSGVRDVLEERYGDLLPGMADTVIDMAYDRFYARPGLDLKSRYIAIIAALSAMGAQTAPQLRINIESGLKVGLSEIEVAEVIWQMALYGGLPAAINALNTLRSISGEK